jgi:hypothetical protein
MSMSEKIDTNHNWSSPEELLGHPPRQFCPTKLFYVGRNITYLAMIFFIVGICTIAIPLMEMHSAQSLEANGIAVDGYVTGFRKIGGAATSRGSSPPRYLVEYSYGLAVDSTAQKNGSLFHGEGKLFRNPDSDFSVWLYKKVPVIYDPTNPKKSMLRGDTRPIDDENLYSFGFVLLIISVGILLIVTRPTYLGFFRLKTLTRLGGNCESKHRQ